MINEFINIQRGEENPTVLVMTVMWGLAQRYRRWQMLKTTPKNSPISTPIVRQLLNVTKTMHSSLSVKIYSTVIYFISRSEIESFLHKLKFKMQRKCRGALNGRRKKTPLDCVLNSNFCHNANNIRHQLKLI